MSQASRFLFERDFRSPQGDAKSAADAAAAEERGYRRGLAEGRAQAEAEAQAALIDATQRLATAAATLLAQADADAAAREEEAIAFAAALARKLAGAALKEEPLAALRDAAEAAFEHLRGVPHLVARVNDLLVDDVDRLLRQLARERGFEGRVVVLGEPEIGPGEACLEWADGGVARDRTRVETAAQAVVARLFPYQP
ncbi:MAG TPA: flagellar assembly protein FliH [Beijerinckiaceae bacterium]|jgi:flagellar assembly protein FliH